MKIKGYSYDTKWSQEDHAYVGTVAEFPSLSWVDGSPKRAFAGIRLLTKDVVKDMVEAGESLPIVNKH
jgi:hypothetical protein